MMDSGFSGDTNRNGKLSPPSLFRKTEPFIKRQLRVKYMPPWQPGSGNRAIRMTKLAELRPFMEAIDKKS
jgi:hypothetical protein